MSAREDGALHVAGRVIVVVVEADLADCDDLGAGGERGELGMERLVERRRVVRMNTDRRRHPSGPRLRQRHGRARRREIPPHADDDEADHAGGTRARNDGIGAVREVLRVEVAMGIDDRGGHRHGACPDARRARKRHAR